MDLPAPREPLWPRAERALRMMAAAISAGAVMGILVGGVGGRLAMLLLARLNPGQTGRLSDDGFVVGHFDLGNTIGFVVFVGTIAGVLGSLVFLAVRDLRFGPPWFRWSSMTVGPAVVAGALLVQTGGIDFKVFDPRWLGIALFVLIPGLYAAGIVWLGDRWLEPDRWFRTATWGLLPLVLLLAAGPMIVPTGVAVALHVTWPRWGHRLPLTPAHLRGAARGAAVALFALAVVDLVRDARVLL